jgi:hypothetical protein
VQFERQQPAPTCRQQPPRCKPVAAAPPPPRPRTNSGAAWTQTELNSAMRAAGTDAQPPSSGRCFSSRYSRLTNAFTPPPSRERPEAGGPPRRSLLPAAPPRGTAHGHDRLGLDALGDEGLHHELRERPHLLGAAVLEVQHRKLQGHHRHRQRVFGGGVGLTDASPGRGTPLAAVQAPPPPAHAAIPPSGDRARCPGAAPAASGRAAAPKPSRTDPDGIRWVSVLRTSRRDTSRLGSNSLTYELTF